MQTLERRLGLFSVITISVSSMLASGLFVVPGIGFLETGSSLFLAFILAAICILPAAMSKAELATAMPTSGGTYVFIERCFGPLIGTVSGLGLYLSILLKVAFALVGLGAYFMVLSSIDINIIVFASLFAIVFLNIVGVGKVSSLLTGVLIITIVGILGVSFLSKPLIELSHFDSFFAHGYDGFISATAVVFISYAGILKVAAIAEEVKNPKVVIPGGILWSLLIATVLYAGVSFIMASVLPMESISGSKNPIYIWSQFVGGSWVGITMAVIAILTIINAANAGVLAASRFPFAMSRDQLLPKSLGKLHRKFLTPLPSILLSGLIIGLAILFLDIAKIAKLASAFMILIYMLENLCVIVLRESRPQWYKPDYKAPFYPVLQSIGLLSGGVFLWAMGFISVIAILVVSIPGVLFYFFYSRNKTSRKGVLGMKGPRTDITEQANTFHFDYYDSGESSEVVIGLFGKEKSPDMLIEMALALTDKGEVEVASLIEIPEQASPQDILEEPPKIRSLRRRALAMQAGEKKTIHFDSIVTHDLSQSIFQISQSAHCKWLLIEWQGKKRGALTFHDPMAWLKSQLHCHLAVYRDAGVRYIRKILIYLNNDKNDAVILEMVRHLNLVFNSQIYLLNYNAKNIDPEQDAKDKSSIFAEVKANFPEIKICKVTGENMTLDIIEETANFDLFVLGSPDYKLKDHFVRSFDSELISKANCSVLALHASVYQ